VRVAVVGLGYVGLVMSACLAEQGNDVVGIEVSAERIQALLDGRMPFHEPGLAEIVSRNVAAGRLTFAGDPVATSDADVVFIAVGTHDGNGGWQTGTIQSCLNDVAPLLSDHASLVVRSTLPPWFLAHLPNIVARIREEAGRPEIPVMLNPEFTKEGTAVKDFLEPERVVIGIARDIDGRGEETLRDLYRSTTAPVIAMSATNAALSKLGANLFLATKISFANELALLCDLYGGDVDEVVSAMAHDHRIGGSFLRAGIGFGGSCLPHQVVMTVAGAAEAGVSTPLFAAVAEVNLRQRMLMVDRLADRVATGLAGARIAILGVTFKPDTDDLRDAPSIDIARELIARGARVVAFDPMRSALERFADLVPGVQITDTAELALTGADAAALVTEWLPLRRLDWAAIAPTMHRAVLVDGRNALVAADLVAAGFDYTSFGRQSAPAQMPIDAVDREPVAVMDADATAAPAVASERLDDARLDLAFSE
jgi:UDPglucose 6-dehydrogenase